MFLTEEEFITLSAIVMEMSKKEIKEKFGITFYMNDTRISNLCKKYGIKNKGNIRGQIVEKADMKKVQVFKQAEIPYYQYEQNGKFHELVHKVKITKEDVLKLSKYFENVTDNKQEFELISYDDYFNFYKGIDIKNLTTGKKERINYEITD